MVDDGLIGGIIMHFKTLLCFLVIMLILGSCKANPEVLNEGSIWITDYQQALQNASEENKPILINFTGSDWCGWCMRLDEEVFSQSEFLNYAEENLILLKLDFPRNIPQPDDVVANNRALAQKYDIKGFPTIVLIDNNENIIGITGYQPGGANVYVQHLIEIVSGD